MKKLYNFLVVLFISAFAFNFASAQWLRIYDVDASNYPDIRASFKLFDIYHNEIRNLNINDFVVTENSVNRTIKSISCGEEKDKGMLSVIFLIDRSVSMRAAVDSYNPGKPAKWEIANEAARTMINSLSADSSEFALIAFSFNAKLMHDFTNDKRDVIDSLDVILHMGSADYNAAFLSDQAGNRNGAIYLAKNARYKPLIILITDGLSVDQYGGGEFRFHDVVDSAKRANASIYTLNLGSNSNYIHEYISDSTGGKWYSATTMEGARLACGKIIAAAQSKTFYPPCEIVWESDCSGGNAKIESLSDEAKLSRDVTYAIPDSVSPHFEAMPRDLYFLNVGLNSYKEIDVDLKSQSNFINVFGANCSDSRFTVASWNGQEPPFRLDKGDSRTITVRYTATDTSYANTRINILSSACDSSYLNVNTSWFMIKDVDMGSVPVGKICNKSFDITNRYGCDVSVYSLSIKGLNESDFNLPYHSAKFNLPNGDAIPIQVEFLPSAAGYRESNLYVETSIGTFQSKVFGNATTETAIADQPDNSAYITITPNPASAGLVEVQFDIPGIAPDLIRITDNLGKVVMDFPAKNFTAGQNKIEFNADHLSMGVYYLTIQSHLKSYTRKISIIK